tara:strand:+ start:4345 stop:5076 length:732 start_codon:yes stop_codon:yes gene_type:complete
MIAMYDKVKHKTIEERDFKGNFAVQYIEKRKGVSLTGRKTVKKAKKCGYCRETGHNRKACPQMAKDKAFIIKANEVWRNLWSETATKYGLTPASLIKVTDRSYNYSQGGYISKTQLCTVGAELPENLNVFALGEENKQQEILIPLLGYKPEYGNNNINARLLVKAKSDSMASALFSYSYSWGNIEGVEVVAKSSYTFPDEWFSEPPTEDIDYALKKWTQDQMNNFITKCKKLVENYGGDYGIS